MRKEDVNGGYGKRRKPRLVRLAGKYVYASSKYNNDESLPQRMPSLIIPGQLSH
jgi:hypothetical protein